MRKLPPSLETVEGLVDEVEEWHSRVTAIRKKLRRHKRGSEPYLRTRRFKMRQVAVYPESGEKFYERVTKPRRKNEEK